AVDAPSPRVSVPFVSLSPGAPRADSTYAGGRRGKECAARHERSNDWRRGAQRPRPGIRTSPVPSDPLLGRGISIESGASGRRLPNVMLRRFKSKRSIILALALASLSLVGCTGSTAAAGGTSINAPGVKLELGGAGSDNATALQFFLLLTILSLVPAILMMVTSFVRITIVL